ALVREVEAAEVLAAHDGRNPPHPLGPECGGQRGGGARRQLVGVERRGRAAFLERHHGHLVVGHPRRDRLAARD
ncbi:MAG: hypothetical protein AVDCRST_MAG91-1338, partial [uncultured Sphingomonadaceae bacterium]